MCQSGSVKVTALQGGSLTTFTQETALTYGGKESLRAAHAKISQSVKEYLKAEEARHVSALEQVRATMKTLE